MRILGFLGIALLLAFNAIGMLIAVQRNDWRGIALMSFMTAMLAFFARTLWLGRRMEREAAFRAFDKEVTVSRQLSTEARRARLAKASKKPKLRRLITTVFERNPDVVAEVLVQANGTCARCHNPAPFLRTSDGSPYLEVHHRLQLAHGGEDTVENAEALCPNCHRKSHYGQLDG